MSRSSTKSALPKSLAHKIAYISTISHQNPPLRQPKPISFSIQTYSLHPNQSKTLTSLHSLSLPAHARQSKRVISNIHIPGFFPRCFPACLSGQPSAFGRGLPDYFAERISGAAKLQLCLLLSQVLTTILHSANF